MVPDSGMEQPRVVPVHVPTRVGVQHGQHRMASVRDKVMMMATNSQGTNAPTWKVENTSPRTTVINGQPVTGHVVTFVTGAGNRSEVFVTDSGKSLDAARKVIAEQAAYVDGISSLTG